MNGHMYLRRDAKWVLFPKYKRTSAAKSRWGRCKALSKVLNRAANSVDFYIECKFEFSLFYEFDFDIFIFASSSSGASPVKIYQVFFEFRK